MPRLGMEPIRREALVEATIEEIGRHGSLDVTVGQIARRAGVSPALAHHYFGGKSQIFLAAMRRILTVFGAGVRRALKRADGPEDRVRAIIRACFEPENFRPDVVAAWLNFYVLAQTDPEARRLLTVYHRRLHSNLVCALRPILGRRCADAAEEIAAMIDGVYLRQALKDTRIGAEEAMRLVNAQLDRLLKEHRR